VAFEPICHNELRIEHRDMDMASVLTPLSHTVTHAPAVIRHGQALWPLHDKHSRSSSSTQSKAFLIPSQARVPTMSFKH
jgi:hypothetical protein